MHDWIQYLTEISPAIFQLLVALILLLVAMAISRIPEYLKQQVQVLEQIRDKMGGTKV